MNSTYQLMKWLNRPDNVFLLVMLMKMAENFNNLNEFEDNTNLSNFAEIPPKPQTLSPQLFLAHRIPQPVALPITDNYQRL